MSWNQPFGEPSFLDPIQPDCSIFIQEPYAAMLETSEVGKERGYQFPYFGYGYA